MPKRGSTLYSTLMLASIGLLLMLAMGQAMIFQHQFVLFDEDTEQARNLASGVIHKAMAKLNQSLSYHSPCQWSFQDTRQPNLGQLTFTPGSSLPHSVNNLNGGVTVSGYNGIAVAPGTAHLIGVGQYGTATVKLQCVYFRPPFPRGLISTGPITLEATQILGLVPEAQYPGTWAQVPSSQRRPSHVFSNANRTQSLTVGLGSLVSGNAASCGGVKVEQGATVGGEVQSNCSPEQVPAFDIPDMINRVAGVAGLHPYLPGAPVNDFMVTPGGLTVNGDLVLDGGTLAVRGPLTVRGAIRGRGVLLVNGATTVDQGAVFEADRQVALLSQGSIQLKGQDQRFYFQGLLYSQASVDAEQLTVLGSVVCNSSNPNDDVHLKNVQLISLPIHVQARQGLPLVSSVADDTYRFYFQSVPDPLRPGQFLYYGKADYCEAYDYDFHREPIDLRVYFNPGEVIWTRRNQVVERQPYDGRAQSVQQIMNRVATYFGESGSAGDVAGYLRNLNQGQNPGQFLEINLNEIIRPQEQARILLWGPLDGR